MQTNKSSSSDLLQSQGPLRLSTEHYVCKSHGLLIKSQMVCFLVRISAALVFSGYKAVRLYSQSLSVNYFPPFLGYKMKFPTHVLTTPSSLLRIYLFKKEWK